MDLNGQPHASAALFPVPIEHEARLKREPLWTLLKERILFFLPEIEPRFLVRPPYILITVLTLSWLQIHRKESTD
jgi:hypothetical protein